MIDFEDIFLAVYNVIMMLYSLHLFLSCFSKRKPERGIVKKR